MIVHASAIELKKDNLEEKLKEIFSNSEKKKLVKLNKKIAKVIFTSFKIFNIN